MLARNDRPPDEAATAASTDGVTAAPCTPLAAAFVSVPTIAVLLALCGLVVTAGSLGGTESRIRVRPAQLARVADDGFALSGALEALDGRVAELDASYRRLVGGG